MDISPKNLQAIYECITGNDNFFYMLSIEQYSSS